jgi:hypothetical protein
MKRLGRAGLDTGQTADALFSINIRVKVIFTEGYRAIVT